MIRTRPNYIIGIDPDKEKNGIAIISKTERKIQLECLPFPETVEFLRSKYAESTEQFCVYVEASWFNKPNWHVKYGNSPQYAAAVGKSLGENQETGKKLIEMLNYYKIPVFEVRPLKKYWKGQNGKITHDELMKEIITYRLNTVKKYARTNQEERDAALIAISRI